MDRQELLYSLKLRLQMDLSLGSPFAGIIDNEHLEALLHGDSKTTIRPAPVAAFRPSLSQPPGPKKVAPPPLPADTPAPVQRKPYAALVPEVDANSCPEKEQRLASLRKESETCTACALCERRNSVVWGEGSLDAKVMFIGEGPGRDEDEQGRPFVGRSGRLLTDIIEKGMKVPRGQVYIANVVKCRPPGNRDPKPEEVVACSRYLKKQIEVIGPTVIVAVGGVAGCALLALPPKSPGLRGKWHQYDGVPLRVIYHPSYLLRQRGAENKRTRADQETWSDIQTVMGMLG